MAVLSTAEHVQKGRSLDPQHPAAQLLGRADALDDWIVRRHSSKYGKKAAYSGYQQQLMHAMGQQVRSDGVAPASGARCELPPSSRLVALAQPRLAAVTVRAQPANVWTYGALGGLPR